MRLSQRDGLRGEAPREGASLRPDFWRATVRITGLLLAAATVIATLATLALPAPGLPRSAPLSVSGDGMATVTASTRYRAGAARRALLGSGYRHLWETPIRVPVLDLSAVGGGLSPVRAGGGRQTRSLRLQGQDGSEYVFRTVDKDQATGLSWFRRATLGRLRQDQVSALHPAAAPVVARLAHTAGVLHALPVLVVMPDAERLGEFRDEFSGMLGTFEIRPDARSGMSSFTGADRIVDTEELWTHVAEHPQDVIDLRAFLTARLLDVLVGDWDRHDEQWRWALFKKPDGDVWIPIPRDRDYAFANYGGLVPALARLVDPKVVRFDPDYRDLRGLLEKSRELDRRLLCPLPLAAWDSVAESLRISFSDEAIEDAVRSTPPEYLQAGGNSLAPTLRARRDQLPAAAHRIQRYIAAYGCDPSDSSTSTSAPTSPLRQSRDRPPIPS